MYMCMCIAEKNIDLFWAILKEEEQASQLFVFNLHAASKLFKSDKNVQ